MKRLIIMALLLTQPILSETNQYYAYTSHKNSYRKQDSEAYNAAFIALFLGAASGALCRQFEKKCLHDAFVLRCANLIIWGILQNRCIHAITEDLKNEQIPHSPELMKRTAWFASWITYLLVDEATA